MDLGSAQLWNTVKDISALILSALVLIQAMRRGTAFGKALSRKGLRGRRLKIGRFLRGQNTGFKGLGSETESDCRVAVSEERRGPEGVTQECEPALWGADPYQVAVEMAANGIPIGEIARRIAIPRGEIVLAVSFRRSLEQRRSGTACLPGGVCNGGGRKNLPGDSAISK